MSEILAGIFLLSGVGLIIVGMIGMIRLPDVLCRSHAMTKALTLGIFLMLVGLGFFLRDEEDVLKIAMVIIFQILTIPISGHLVSRLALKKNLKRWRHQAVADHRHE